METAELFPYPDGESISLSYIPKIVKWIMHLHVPKIVDFISTCMALFSLSHSTVLSEEQKQNLSMFVDPVAKFFEAGLEPLVSDIL